MPVAMMPPAEVDLMNPGKAAEIRYAPPNPRMDAVHNAGMSAGAQQGYVFSMSKYRKQMQKRSDLLSKIFDFTPLILNGRMMPAVIAEGRRTFALHGSQSGAAAMVEYRIVQPARIITAIPSWRDYLLPEIPAPAPVNPVLYPKTNDELSVWRAGVKQGWAAGEAQAEQVEIEAIHRLDQTYVGMVRFMILKAQGLVQGPVLATGTPRIRVGGETLDIGAQTFSITVPAKFTDPDQWKAVAQ